MRGEDKCPVFLDQIESLQFVVSIICILYPQSYRIYILRDYFEFCHMSHHTSLSELGIQYVMILYNFRVILRLFSALNQIREIICESVTCRSLEGNSIMLTTATPT